MAVRRCRSRWRTGSRSCASVADAADGGRLQRRRVRGCSAAAHPGVVRVLRSAADGRRAGSCVTAHGGRRCRRPARGRPRDARGAIGASVAATLADLHERGVVHGRLDATRTCSSGADGRARALRLRARRRRAPAGDDVAALGAAARRGRRRSSAGRPGADGGRSGACARVLAAAAGPPSAGRRRAAWPPSSRPWSRRRAARPDGRASRGGRAARGRGGRSWWSARRGASAVGHRTRAARSAATSTGADDHDGATSPAVRRAGRACRSTPVACGRVGDRWTVAVVGRRRPLRGRAGRRRGARSGTGTATATAGPAVLRPGTGEVLVFGPVRRRRGAGRWCEPTRIPGAVALTSRPSDRRLRRARAWSTRRGRASR